MSTHKGRSLVLAAMLTAGLSAPALANDPATAQQTAVGQGTMELAASAQDAASVISESYATPTAAPAGAPRARAKAVEPRPLRQSYSGGDYRAAPPLILGIRH
jgi:hypothetical protein